MRTLTQFLPVLALVSSGCSPSSVAPELLARPAERVAGGVGVRWLGAAGFEIRTARRTLLVDPYLTRLPLMVLAFGRLEPDREALAKLDADLILVGHSHFDHLLDAPALSARTRAPILASADACLLASTLDRGSRCLVAPVDRKFTHLGFELIAIPAAHGESLVGVPIDGTNDRSICGSRSGPSPALPPPLAALAARFACRSGAPHVLEMQTGPVFIWVIRARGVSIVHVGTAGLPHDPLALKRHLPDGADVLLIALALRENTPGYVRHLIDVLDPKIVIPHHAGMETYPLTDRLPEDVMESFTRFAAEEGARVRIAHPFETIAVRGSRRAR